MDRTSIIVIVVCFILIGVWSLVLMPKWYPQKPLPIQGTNAPSATVTGTNQVGVVTNVPVLAEAPTNAPRVVVNNNVPEDLVVISNENARYTFTSHGGGLKLVELLKYPETVSTRRLKQPDTNRVATLNSYAPAPTLAILDGEAVQGDGIFKLSKTDNGAVRAEKMVPNGLTIVKDFQLSTNYLVTATVKLENHSGQTLTLPQQEWVVGTATPMGPRDDGSAVGVIWYNGAKTAGDIGTATYFSQTGFMCMPKEPPLEYRGGGSKGCWRWGGDVVFIFWR